MTIVVTGATGNVGRPLVSLLAAAGARVRAITRTPDTARFPAGVQAVSGAVDAVAGASAVFLNSRALGDDLADVVAAARRSGVTKLVALSAINADDDVARQPSRVRGDRNKEVEQLCVDSGLAWVSLRNVVTVHVIAVDQLNAYDILVCDEVVFTRTALDAFVAGPVSGRSVKASARASEVTTEPGTDELAAASVEDSAEPSNADLAASAASVAEVLEPTDDVTEGDAK